MDTPSANKQTVLQYVEAFNRGDSAALRALFAPDAQIQGVLGWGGKIHRRWGARDSANWARQIGLKLG